MKERVKGTKEGKKEGQTEGKREGGRERKGNFPVLSIL